MKDHHRVQRGFTLIEVVIALALTSLIFATLGAALFGLTQGFAKSTARAEREDTMLHVSQALRRAIEQAAPRPAQAGSEPSLVGQPDSLEWLAPMPEASPYRGLHLWRLEAQTLDAANRRLVLTLTPWTPGTSATPYPPQPLVDGLTQIQLHYQDTQSGQWTDHWEQARRPLRVRIEIITKDHGPWPPIVARLAP
ncbi:MAG: prepilin-type N-terminal cleavage/methylation domain-containing protein [Pseudomonadota bacterium]|jgi:prepilin-type N-terminal cleavage/methylation domain-containing protein